LHVRKASVCAFMTFLNRLRLRFHSTADYHPWSAANQ